MLKQSRVPFRIVRPKDSYTRLYRIWCGMHSRCRSKSPHRKRYYKDRGITVCASWSRFRTFKDWALRNGYQVWLSIDRVNNDAGYEPKNCRWVTQRLQLQNKSSNVRVDAFGENKILAEWSRDKRCLVKYETLRRRIGAGWTPEAAITTPARIRCSVVLRGAQKKKVRNMLETTSLRLEKGSLAKLQQLAAAETIRAGKKITASDLMRTTIHENLLKPRTGAK